MIEDIHEVELCLRLLGEVDGLKHDVYIIVILYNVHNRLVPNLMLA